MGFDWFETLWQSIQSYPFFLQILIWVIGLMLILIVVYLLFSLLFFPFMLLYNRMTDKNHSNVLTQSELLIGELTEKIEGASIGEVMEIGSQTARSVYPAKLYKQKDVQQNLLLPVGTQVIIVDFDGQGIALVMKNKNLIE